MTLAWDVEQYHGRRRARVDLPRPPREALAASPAHPAQLDHVTIATSDVDAFAQWYRDVLGFRIMAYTVLDEAPISVFAVLTTNEKSHDLGVVLDSSPRPGRINHYAFWVDTREELLIAADVLMENGTHIEYGPSIHGIGEQNFLYFRDPSGLRIEVNTGGYRNYVPDWEPNTWKPSTGSNNLYRNSAMPMSMTESFPPDEGPRPRPRRASSRRDRGRPAQPVRQARPGLTDRTERAGAASECSSSRPVPQVRPRPETRRHRTGHIRTRCLTRAGGR